MNTNMSIRELTRNGKILTDFDYIDIEDRKSNEYKGVFIPKQYADDVKTFLKKKLKKEKKAQLEALMSFAGIANGDTQNKSIQTLKTEKSSRY